MLKKKTLYFLEQKLWEGMKWAWFAVLFPPEQNYLYCFHFEKFYGFVFAKIDVRLSPH
jgi:hypothetical protein